MQLNAQQAPSTPSPDVMSALTLFTSDMTSTPCRGGLQNAGLLAVFGLR